MVVTNYGSIISPGNEQRNYWGSLSADQPGSANIVGVKNPIIDEIIEDLISSKIGRSLLIIQGLWIEFYYLITTLFLNSILDITELLIGINFQDQVPVQNMISDLISGGLIRKKK